MYIRLFHFAAEFHNLWTEAQDALKQTPPVEHEKQRDTDDLIGGFITRAKAIRSETQGHKPKPKQVQRQDNKHTEPDLQDDVIDISRGTWSKYI